MLKKIILCYILFKFSNFHSYKINVIKECIQDAVNNTNIVNINTNKYYKYEIYNCIYNDNDLYSSYCYKLNNFYNYIKYKNECFDLLKIEIFITYILSFITIILYI